MKKVAIITLSNNNNFGNKLQNYALLKTIEKEFKTEVNTIWIENSYYCNSFKLILKILVKRIKNLRELSRRLRFIDFNKKYLNIYKKKIIFNNDIESIKNNFDYFVVGSDQVWNYNLFNNYNIYFLMKFSKEKCFSYAASFGLSNIPLSLENNYRDGLNHLNKISVRESKGADIIRKINNKMTASVHIDPTMLLESDDWDEIAHRPSKLKSNKYILNYFLGNLSSDRREEINRIAKEYKCDIINILDKKDPLYSSGPSEFLYLEKNAFLICTDSFHSSVFAIIYNRPFIVFDREQKGVENMSSRIDTLIETFKLKNRKYNNKSITQENLKHDYKEAYEILKKERKKSLDYLKEALNTKESD